MSSSRASVGIAVSLLTLVACGGDVDTPDAASVHLDDAFVPEGTDAFSVGVDAPSTSADAAITCSPTSGPATGGAYCDLLELAILRNGDTAEARVTGRLMPDGATGCAVVDEVEVLEDGGASMGTLAGAGAFSTDTYRPLLARGPALAPMLTRCGTDEGRFEGYGLVIRGRVDGGTFEARCGRAEGGSRWPPALRMTCHENLDTPPSWSGAMISSFMGMENTQASIEVPHGPGAAITSITGEMRVIPYSSPFAPGPMAPAPFSIPDLVGNVSEASSPTLGTYSFVHLLASRDVFGATLCPTPPAMPGPGTPVPPVFLLRFGGNSERGAFSTEVYMEYCNRMSL